MTRTYCPGVITAITIYAPLFVFITHRAWIEELLVPAGIAAALAIAGMFHVREGGHVFKAW